jgi:hypothetical protein
MAEGGWIGVGPVGSRSGRPERGRAGWIAVGPADGCAKKRKFLIAANSPQLEMLRFMIPDPDRGPNPDPDNLARSLRSRGNSFDRGLIPSIEG